ncbi:hypothetical protein [Curtobacterium sp. MCBA15_001]|uniref:hypothetical protein n=1 Tax=Curtobacterium sp. MCBA15_001 TaxID=1898731 RepID=UPI0008DD59BE|nr:hypothetical protein [Curtobacterium sp. MCBA15_001]OIH93745.1 hypothetical protein BIU90_08925 [Curtobacterium sp. MCBA15_001]
MSDLSWLPEDAPTEPLGRRLLRVWRRAGPVVSAVALVCACLLVSWYAGVADHVEWECAVSTCGTDDVRSLAPIASWALMVLTVLGVVHLPGRGWWAGVALMVFGGVSAWSIDWWQAPGADLELAVTPIAAGVVGGLVLVFTLGRSVDRARGRRVRTRREHGVE